MRLDTQLNGLDGFNTKKIRNVIRNRHIVHGKPRYQTCPNANNLNGLDINGFLTSLTGSKPTTPPIVGINSVLKPSTPQSRMVTTSPTTGKTFMQSVTDGVQQAIPSIVTLANTAIAIKAQDKLAKLNVQRAASGQAPIDIATYNEANAPVVKIQGGVDSGTSKGLMYGGLAIGAAVLIMAMRKRG